MRRTDPTVFTPREREQLLHRLAVLVQVKEAVRLFEDGDVDLGTAVDEIAAVMAANRDRP